MDFTTIFKKQILLDNAIEKEHKVSKSETRDKKILALIVEIAEFANEVQIFKYWKKNKKIDKEKILEEFVDAIHFFVSLGYLFQIDALIEPKITSNDQTAQLLSIYSALGKLSEKPKKENLIEAFSLYMGIAKLLQITDEDILKSYERKNKINFERIANNY